MVKDLNDLAVNFTRATEAAGWRYSMTTAWNPGSELFGTVYDSENYFVGQTIFSVATEVALWIAFSNQPVDIQDGDYLICDYGAIVNIYPPALSGNIDAYYYIGLDGATYLDSALTQLAKAVPTAITRTGLENTSVPTPAPTSSSSRKTSGSETPVPALSLKPTPIPGPVAFDLIDILDRKSVV